jgi:thiamine-monophosphate kinase
VIVSLGLPIDSQANFAAALVGALNCVCREHETYYLGGDTNQSLELIIDCTAVGTVPQTQLLRRNGAKPGDMIAITGEFGYTGALFEAVLRGHSKPANLVSRIRKHALSPRARIKEGQALASTGVVSSSIDSSDGLAWSLHELSAASRVGFRIDSLPIPEICKQFSATNDLDPIDLALYGGEEFELVVTFPATKWALVSEVVQRVGGSLIPIGEVVEEPEKILLFNGEERKIHPKGYEHFSK